MNVVETFAIIFALYVVLEIIIERIVEKPPTIILMGVSLGIFGILRIMLYVGFTGLETHAEHVLKGINFSETVLDGFLCFLLFAGSLHIDLEELLEYKEVVGLLATVSVVIATLLVAGMFSLLTLVLGVSVPLIYCLIFGALIAPTDAVAVLAFIKSAGLPRSIAVKFTGESLFNDGVSIALFAFFVSIAIYDAPVTILGLPFALLYSLAGGMVLGIMTGIGAFWLLRATKNPVLEVAITLMLVLGTFSLATRWGVSGPVAVVAAGLFIGNHGFRFHLSKRKVKNLESFWKLVDGILNGLLCVLIGFEILALKFTSTYVMVALGTIPIVLIGRYLSVRVLMLHKNMRERFSPHAEKILTWGGIRGGISIALVLALPPSTIRDLLLITTFAVVSFSLLIMGSTMKYFLSYIGMTKEAS